MTIKTKITPCANYIYVQPKEVETTAGGIALPQVSRESAEGMRTWRGFVFAYSLMAYRQICESIGRAKADKIWFEGAEIEYYGHSTTRIDGVEFHVIKPVDVWCIVTEVEADDSDE